MDDITPNDLPGEYDDLTDEDQFEREDAVHLWETPRGSGISYYFDEDGDLQFIWTYHNAEIIDGPRWNRIVYDLYYSIARNTNGFDRGCTAIFDMADAITEYYRNQIV